MNVDISPDVWFQQDGATSHTSSPALEWLKSRFGDKIISQRTEFSWSVTSPDPSPLDYFLWGFIKEKVFKSNPRIILALKQLIEEVSSINQETLAKVINNFKKRIDLCIEKQGGHFKHLLKTK